MEYAKVVLPNVSSNKKLFKKELLKCLSWIDKNEIAEFIKWCYQRFSRQHPDILAEAFAGIAA